MGGWLSILKGVIVRPLQKEPVRTLLTALSVSLGVAVVVAIELAGEASVGNFRSSMEAVVGEADFEITATGGVDETTFVKLATSPNAWEVTARMEDNAIEEKTGQTVPLVGVDLVAVAGKADQTALQRLSQPAENVGLPMVWLGSRLAKQVNSQQVSLLINDRTQQFAVAGAVPADAGKLAEDVVVMDIGDAQKALDRSGRIDRVEVFLPEGADIAEWKSKITPLLDADAQLTEAGTQSAENRKMLDGFRWNVRILSYIALVVGAYLIYNTIAVSVVRRRNELGILRALGASRRLVMALFLGEAALFGAVGALLGLVLGRVLAEGAVRLMGLTVEILYVSGKASAVSLGWSESWLAIAAGVGVAVLAALAPAWEAASVHPTEAMARGRQVYEVRANTARYAWIALLFSIAAAVLSQLPKFGTKPWFGYLAGLFIIAGGSLATPMLVKIMTLAADGPMRRWFGVEGLLAVRSLNASAWRSAVLTAAVATAIAMMVSIGMMVGSFRQSVLTWLDNQLVADFYLRPSGQAAVDRHPTIAVSVADELERLPGVAAVDRFRVYEIRYGGATATLAGGQTEIADNFQRIAFLPGTDREKAIAGLIKGDSVFVSEPFANKHNVKVGDSIELALGGAKRKFPVLAIYYDYASERGYIVMDRRTMLKYLPDPNPSNLAVYVKAGFDKEQVRLSMEQAMARRSIGIFASGAIRQEAIVTFDRTFAITYALEAVAIAVAVMGVAGSLLALVYDRRREIGLTRFLGASLQQVKKLILLEAGVLGVLANVVGLAMGVALGLLLIFVINKQSFGWTIRLHWPVMLVLGAMLGIYVSTIFSALYPASVAARLNPIDVVHEE
jgi:putative ABC transport system permease protein